MKLVINIKKKEDGYFGPTLINSHLRLLNPTLQLYPLPTNLQDQLLTFRSRRENESTSLARSIVLTLSSTVVKP